MFWECNNGLLVQARNLIKVFMVGALAMTNQGCYGHPADQLPEIPRSSPEMLVGSKGNTIVFNYGGRVVLYDVNYDQLKKDTGVRLSSILGGPERVLEAA